MYKLIIRQFVLVLFIGVLSLLVTSDVQAIGFKISPIRYDLEANPGQTLKEILTVQNKGPGSKSEFLVKDFLGRDESGAPMFVDGLEGSKEGFALSEWISFPEETTFRRDETKDIPFSIKIPKDAEPGSHYASIFVQQKSGDVEGSSVGTISRVGALIFIKVAGDIKEDGKIIDFNVPSELMDDENIAFSVTIENTGNIHLIPKGKVYLKDESGNILKEVGTEPVFNVYGGIEKMKLVDYIRFNVAKNN